jgi:hypothetical protein
VNATGLADQEVEVSGTSRIEPVSRAGDQERCEIRPRGAPVSAARPALPQDGLMAFLFGLGQANSCRAATDDPEGTLHEGLPAPRTAGSGQ